MLLFSSIEARAMETPSVVRRRSTDANKLVRNFSSASISSNSPIENNSIQKTLERITQNQSQLAKSFSFQDKPGNNMNNYPSSDDVDQGMDNTDGPSPPSGVRALGNILKEQERLLEQAKQNRSPVNVPPQLPFKNNVSRQETTKTFVNESMSSPTTVQQSLSQSAIVTSIPLISSLTPTPSPVQPMTYASSSSAYNVLTSSQPVIESQQPNLPTKNVISFNPKPFKAQLSNECSDQSGIAPGMSFDFTKTPRSFLVQRKFGPGEGQVKIAAPKLEFISANVSRSYTTSNNNNINNNTNNIINSESNNSQNNKTDSNKESNNDMMREARYILFMSPIIKLFLKFLMYSFSKYCNINLFFERISHI